MKNKLCFFLIFVSLYCYAQDSKKGVLNIKKIGFLYNYANKKNFLFDDKDYAYHTNTYKLQAFYYLGNWKSLDFDLIVQPQVQVIKHQLINKYFILPNEDHFQEKIAEFSKLKTMHIYALELGFAVKKQLLSKLELQLTIGLALATIDTRTERLAKGFTFVENGSLGLNYQTFNKTTLYLGTNVGHVSNFDTKSPNNGYSILGIEVGVSYKL
ncbi:acyloxyacyl hydrolase [Polaribacter sp. MSW13]|uniref:Acyloxyacyl hydrolase n=1 Tax=Polaribacter marinus TaxID=2916838 RepID=A0A9X1VRS8_9FLAO|nr:acyloxyacyl hydrolase [Polaribacter marinus]MCI2228346.1 acyloxyacyl hydrolase [Polaribacter marinus]